VQQSFEPSPKPTLVHMVDSAEQDVDLRQHIVNMKRNEVYF
jgi:hypothetical protein